MGVGPLLTFPVGSHTQALGHHELAAGGQAPLHSEREERQAAAVARHGQQRLVAAERHVASDGAAGRLAVKELQLPRPRLATSSKGMPRAVLELVFMAPEPRRVWVCMVFHRFQPFVLTARHVEGIGSHRALVRRLGDRVDAGFRCVAAPGSRGLPSRQALEAEEQISGAREVARALAQGLTGAINIYKPPYILRI